MKRRSLRITYTLASTLIIRLAEKPAISFCMEPRVEAGLQHQHRNLRVHDIARVRDIDGSGFQAGVTGRVFQEGTPRQGRPVECSREGKPEALLLSLSYSLQTGMLV